MRAPGWMLDRGWSITPEVAGVTSRDGLGPHLAPAVAWLRRQSGEVTALIGGRNLAASIRTLELSLNGAHLPDVPVVPGFFLARLTLPAGALSGSAGYQPLEVRTSAGSALTLEQFDAQPDGVPMVAFDAGWQEPEYNPRLGLSWRWTSERADLWVRPVGRPVTLRISGESPLKYFDAPPHVRVLAGDRELAAFDPAADFERTIELPDDVLVKAAGRVTIATSRFFVPAQRGGPPDQRHLALRIYRIQVDP